jgi:hypothetical protein
MKETDIRQVQGDVIDKDLISMFLKMTPEDRLITNDNTIRTILDLRNGFKKGSVSYTDS